MVLILLAAAITAVAVYGVRALVTPDLGGPPRGPDDGDTEMAVAAALGPRLAAGLAAAPHAAITLSEHDMTVVLRAENPDRQRLRDPEARVRAGLLVVDGRTTAGPFTVVAIGRMAVRLTTDPGGPPRLSVEVRSVDVGEVALPSFARDAIARRLAAGSVNLQDVLSANPILAGLSIYLECVRVGQTGMTFGFHRPDTRANADGCL
ncbi:MAG: hypothetical protein E6J14_04185 [Chloroflexi bacterium]|nr:MAG: hypothetical protein E6J14_04185 [Chloroflexota bacterium]